MWGERDNKLPPGTPIGSWSSTLNNVAWSKDNIIAVGGGENVTLLTPRYRSVKSEDRDWDRLDIRINNFTDEEVPLMLPLSWKSVSMGEEQSEAFCSALAWSPPGLGKHKRCVLAVLTANHILALYECVGKPDVATDWKRVCIVNHILDALATAENVAPDAEPKQEDIERRKIKQRIRSFAWSPALLSTSSTGIPGASVTLSHPYLAISNECGEVFILKVKSPYDLLSPDVTQWTVSIVHTYIVQANVAKKDTIASCMPGRYQRKRAFVDQLAWSPWARDASGALSSVLAMSTQSTLQCKVIRAEITTNDSFLEMGPIMSRLVDDNNANTQGPMKWMSKPSKDGEMFLLYPCRKVLYCLVFHLRKATGIRVTKQPLDNIWDELSGMAFTKDQHGRSVIQLTYNMSSANAQVLGWPLPLTDVEPIPPPPWQQSLKEAELLFSEENDLDGHAMTRTYGIDASPLGDLIAINSSNHPTDGVEYIIASDQISVLNITPREAFPNEILPLSGGPSHASEISAEGALFSLQHFVGSTPANAPIDNIIQSSLLHTLDLADAPDFQQYQMPITEDTPVRTIMRQMRENVLFHKDAIASRTKQLSSFARKTIPKTMPVDPEVIRRVVTEVVRMPHFISEASDLSQKITHIHCLVLAKLDAIDGRREQSDLSDQDVETCGICSSSIAFESLRWARCPNGHQFGRCALSFLAIQTPGAAKFCGICNTQYLNEHLIPDMIASSGDAADPQPAVQDNPWNMAKHRGAPKEPLTSLVRVLFSAVDRCICCGGKFVG